MLYPVCDVVGANPHILRITTYHPFCEVEQGIALFIQIGVVTAEVAVRPRNLFDKQSFDICTFYNLIAVKKLLKAVDYNKLGGELWLKQVR